MMRGRKEGFRQDSGISKHEAKEDENVSEIRE